MKHWYRSRTIWVMVLTTLAALITGITGENWLDGDIQVAILSIAGLVLRIKTKSGLSK